MSQSLMERYDNRIAGVLSCYDRVVITGTLPGVCYADGMTRYLNAKGIRIFDYPEFAKTLRDPCARLRGNAGCRNGCDDRAHRQEQYPQRGHRRASSAATRRPPRT